MNYHKTKKQTVRERLRRFLKGDFGAGQSPVKAEEESIFSRANKIQCNNI
jgi:hypothetical protein